MSDDGGPLGLGILARSKKGGLLGLGILKVSREDAKTQVKSQAAQFVSAMAMQEANSRGLLTGGIRDRLLKRLFRP